MRNKYKQFIAFFSLAVVCTISLGYAAFCSEMSISNIVADIRIASDVRVTSIAYVSGENNATPVYENYDVDSILIGTKLGSASAKATYRVNVTNFGNTEMGIYELTGLPEGLTYTITDYNLKEKLCDTDGSCTLGAIQSFYITFMYDDGYQPGNEAYDIKLDFDFRKMHTITYTGIKNNNYPTSVIDGGSFEFTATEDIPPKIVPFVANNRIPYLYVNNKFVCNDVTGDVNLVYKDKVYIKRLSADDIYYKTTAYEPLIDNIYFVDYVNLENAIYVEDFSESTGTNEIVSWVDSDRNMYIGSEFDIYANQLGYAFNSMESVYTIGFDNLNTSEATTMSNMFRNCSSLVSLDVSSFDTSNVRTMYNMFASVALTSTDFVLDVSGFNTSKVTNMNSMFNNTAPKSTKIQLDVSGFDTSNVTEFAAMFRNAGYSNPDFVLDVSNFNTSKVTGGLNSMFYNTGYINPNFTLDVSNFNTSNCTSMADMFNGAGYNSSVFQIDVSGFNTSKVKSMQNMFRDTGRSNPNFVLDVSGFDTTNTTNFMGMFINTGYISTKMDTSITIKNPSTNGYTGMFTGTALNTGSKIMVYYTDETSSIVDAMVATRSDGANVFKALAAIDVDSLSIGDVVQIDIEKFNVVGISDTSISLLAQYNVSDKFKQSTSAVNYTFADSVGWVSANGQNEIDVQLYASNPKTIINGYVSYLNKVTNSSDISGDLITLKELKGLGCTILDDYSTSSDLTCANSEHASWLVNNQYWWTRSMFPANTSLVWLVYNDGTLNPIEYTDSKVVRPVITVSKNLFK